jgi:hypothetical protein
MNRKTAFLACAFVLMFSVAAQRVSAQADHTSYRGTLSADFTVLAADNCTNEDVQVFGTVDYVMQNTTDGSGGLHFTGEFTPHLTAQAASGRRYRAVGPGHETVYQNFSKGQTVTQLINITRLLTPGGGNLVITENLHFSTDADGDVTVNFDKLIGGCVG